MGHQHKAMAPSLLVAWQWAILFLVWLALIGVAQSLLSQEKGAAQAQADAAAQARAQQQQVWMMAAGLVVVAGVGVVLMQRRH